MAAPPVTRRSPALLSSPVSGVLQGVGIAGFVDEAVFHLLLHWHHFYDRGTPAAGLVSDGVFHAVSWFAMVAGFVVLSELRARGEFVPKRWLGGLLVGLGGFQLYDGTIQHKLLRLHQIRYDVDIAPYDVVWNVLAVVALGAGIALLARTRARR